MQDVLLKLLQDGNTSIPNFLLDNYAKLGMTNNEFLLYLQIKKEQSREMGSRRWINLPRV